MLFIVNAEISIKPFAGVLVFRFRLLDVWVRFRTYTRSLTEITEVASQG